MAASLYDVHPTVTLMVGAVARRTGRPLEEWTALAAKSGPKRLDALTKWLAARPGMAADYAGYVAAATLGEGEDFTPKAYLRAAERYVADMYVGPKAALRPIHDRLIAMARALGGDVRVCPCKTVVPLFRKRVFAQVRPSARTRVDFGLALKGVKGPARLIDTGGAAKGDRITHRIAIADVSEIDGEVGRWMREAYERDV